MENNISLTNKHKAFAIFMWTIRKYLPLSIAYWILLFLSLPMVELFGMIVCFSQYDFKEYVTGMKDISTYLPGTFFAGIVILFSIIITIIAFSYMHNKRCVDLFGSFPISRRTLFFARYFAALVMCIVPMIVLGLIGALLTFSDDAMIEIFKTMGYLILGVTGNVSFIAFISVCCGTVADVLISYCVINAVYPICVAICYWFPVSVIPGLQGGYIGTAVFTLFSPAAAPFVGIFGNSEAIHIVWWIAFTLVLVAGCFVLCRKRKAETAQNAFAFATVEIVIKFVTCFAAGFGVGWIFANIGEAYGTIKAQYVWFFIGMAIGILVADFLLHLVFHRGVSKFAISLIECGVVAVTTTAFLFVITTGAFGYDERIPDAGEVEQVCMIKDNNKFVVNKENLLKICQDDKQTINDVLQLHNNLVTEYRKTKKGVYPIVEMPDEVTYDEDAPYYIELNYQLKNGKTVFRGYDTSGMNVKIPDKLDAKFTVSDEYVLNHIPEKYIETIEVYKNLLSYSLNRDTEKKTIQLLVDALKKDVKEQGVSKKSGKEGFSIYISYTDDDYRYFEDCAIEIPDTYVNTIRIIQAKKLYFSEYGWLVHQVYTDLEPEEAEEYLAKDVVKTIYFKVPDEWNQEADVKCMLLNDEEYDFYTSLDSKFADCEKVSENVWKYELHFESDIYQKVMFYQPSEEKFYFSGSIKISEDESMLVLGKKKKNRDVTEYYTNQYKYEWVPFEE